MGHRREAATESGWDWLAFVIDRLDHMGIFWLFFGVKRNSDPDLSRPFISK